MKKESVAKLIHDFPLLYSEKYRPGYVGDGWFPLLYKSSQQITRVITILGLTADNIPRIDHWELSNGALFISADWGDAAIDNENYWLSQVPQFIDEICRKTEQESLTVCRSCGKNGQMITMGDWNLVFCHACESDFRTMFKDWGPEDDEHDDVR
jgi:hypothetical protein